MATTTVPEVSFLRLGDLASNKGAIVSGPFGSNIGTKFFRDSGVPLIRGNNLSIGCFPYFKEDGFVFITEEKAEELRNCASIKGDIILTAAGTLGQTGIITEENIHPKYIISNKQIRVRVDPNLSDSLFVYYWLSSPQMKWVVESYNSGSTVPLINLGSVRRFPIPNFPLTTQKKISEILSTIDSKLLLQNKINSTLQSQISSLFRSWFIDFDPVKAKLDGKLPYGMDAQTAALFPDSFEDSELGPIPTGWHVVSLADCIQANARVGWKGLSVSEYVDSGPYIVTGPQLVSGSIQWEKCGHVPLFRYDESPDIMLEENDVVLTKDGTIGKVALVHSMPGKATLAAGLFRLRARRDVCGHGFVLCLLNSYLFDSLIWTRVEGAVIPHLYQSHLRAFKFAIPKQDLMMKFEQIVAPFIELMKNSAKAKIDYSNARDALLPRLMSGELSVS